MSKLTPKERYLRRIAAGQPHFTGLRIAKPLRLRLTEGHHARRQRRTKDRLFAKALRILAAPLKTEYSIDPAESQEDYLIRRSHAEVLLPRQS